MAGRPDLAVVEVVQSSGNTVLATGDADGLTVELPFQSETSLLTVATRESHPQLGNGVLIKLTLPVLFSEQDGSRFASELNRRELESLTRSHFLGSWCWHDEFVHYVTFLPNVLNLGDVDLFNFLAASYGRAKWVAETIYGDDWEANRDEVSGARSRRPRSAKCSATQNQTSRRAHSPDLWAGNSSSAMAHMKRTGALSEPSCKAPTTRRSRASHAKWP